MPPEPNVADPFATGHSKNLPAAFQFIDSRPVEQTVELEGRSQDSAENAEPEHPRSPRVVGRLMGAAFITIKEPPARQANQDHFNWALCASCLSQDYFFDMADMRRLDEQLLPAPRMANRAFDLTSSTTRDWFVSCVTPSQRWRGGPIISRFRPPAIATVHGR